MKISKRINNSLLFITSIISAYIVYTLLKVSWFSVMSADDFDFADFIIRDNPQNMIEKLAAAWHLTVTQCTNWQGTFTGHMLCGIFSPATFDNVFLANRVTVVLFAAFFIMSLILFIIGALKYLFHVNNKLIYSAVTLVFLLLLTGYESYEEIFAWYTGAVYNTIPWALGLIGIYYLMKYKQNQCKGSFITAIILGVIASGGNLPVPAFTCSIALIIIISACISSKKINIKMGIVLGAWIVSALINIAMPGNYVRSEITNPDGMNLAKGIKNGFWMAYDRFAFIFGDGESATNVAVILLLCIILGLFLFDVAKEKLKVYVVATALLVLVPFIIAFPNALGNNRYVMPNRTKAFLDIPIYLLIIMMGIVLGMLIRNQLIVLNKYETAAKLAGSVIIIAMFISASGDGYCFKESALYEMHTQLSDGTYQNYYNSCMTLFDILEASEGDIVVTAGNYPQDISHAKLFYIEDVDIWPNNTIAEFFGLKSIIRSTEGL